MIDSLTYVRCFNCKEALQAKNGVRYPVHQVRILVTPEQVKLWQSQGYDIRAS